ncbi:MAG: NAD-dependent epimerase/dehydratase family protein [Elusimicrobia bacterium]|nr:NAD-dependent epimerase/dehydratase family protein [Elusimicrobiota bacterium]
MKILVTGGRGFLASHLAAELRRRHPRARLVRLDRAPAPGIVLCDLSDPEAARRALQRIRPDCVFHLAGTTRPEPWDALWAVHVGATVNLLSAVQGLPARARPKVVVAGSSGEYGRPRGIPVSEGAPCAPLTLYGASKHSQTLAALSFRHAGVPVVVARPFNVIGPGMPENLALGAFARQLARVARGEQPPCLQVGDLSPRRDFIDVRDVARALADLGRSGVPGEVYNVSSGRAVSISALLRGLLEVSGLRVSLRRDPSRVRRGEVADISGDHRKLTALTGWRPEIPLARTLRDVWLGL